MSLSDDDMAPAPITRTYINVPDTTRIAIDGGEESDIAESFAFSEDERAEPAPESLVVNIAAKINCKALFEDLVAYIADINAPAGLV